MSRLRRLYRGAIPAPNMARSGTGYADGLTGASFKINNPDATASRGCGASFSV